MGSDSSTEQCSVVCLVSSCFLVAIGSVAVSDHAGVKLAPGSTFGLAVLAVVLWPADGASTESLLDASYSYEPYLSENGGCWKDCPGAGVWWLI